MSPDAGDTRRVPVLTYHSLDDSASPLSTPPAAFREHMRFLHETGIRAVDLTTAIDDPTESIVAITFDDGFESVYQHAFPVLQRYGSAATVFLVTDYCGSDNGWPSQPPGVLRQRLLSWQHVRIMSEAGVSFGAHTQTHPDLTTLTAHEVEAEMLGSKRAIENVLQRPVTTFAYPYGSYDDGVRRLAGRHFSLACATTLGFSTEKSDRLCLERLDAYYLRNPAMFRNLFSWKLRAYIRFRRIVRDAGRALLRRRNERVAMR